MEVLVGIREVFSGPDDEEEKKNVTDFLKGYMDYVNLSHKSGRNLSVT